MKPETRIWIKCENVGKPADTLVRNDSARNCVKAMAEWLMQTYMGQKIRINIARTEMELHESRRSSNVHSMMNELDSIIANGEDNVSQHE